MALPGSSGLAKPSRNNGAGTQDYEGVIDGRNPYDGRDRLDSFHIVPVVLSEIAALKQLMTSKEGETDDHETINYSMRHTASSGAVLLLRCSDESFDTVMKSLNQQDIQLAINMLDQQVSLEEQTENSLTHLTQLYRQTSMEKFLNTAHALMKSQQRLAWIRSRILRCMSKHVTLLSNGQIESNLEPLLKRVLRFPDLAYKYTPEDDATDNAAESAPTRTSPDGHAVRANGNGHSPRGALSTSPSETLEQPVEEHVTAQIIQPVEAAPSPSRHDTNTPTNTTRADSETVTPKGGTPQPDGVTLSPLVGLLISRLDKEGVSGRTDRSEETELSSRPLSASPPAVPYNSRSTPGESDGVTPTVVAEVFDRHTPSPLGHVKALSPFVCSLLGRTIGDGVAADQGQVQDVEPKDTPVESMPVASEPVESKPVESMSVPAEYVESEPVESLPLRSQPAGKTFERSNTMPRNASILAPPDPPRRSSSYEVLRRISEHVRPSSSSPPDQPVTERADCSPAKSLPEMDALPEGFGSSSFIGNLLHLGARDDISELSASGQTAAVQEEDDVGQAIGRSSSAPGGSEDTQQFVGDLSSLMTSRLMVG